MNPGDETLGNAPLKLGDLAIAPRAFLAPMSGITDIGMRRIAQRCGAGLVFSEMVASDSYVKGGSEARLRAEGDGIAIHVVQLAGRDPVWMGEAARLAEANGAAVIDINMGCPAKKVTGGYGGSALLRDLDLALRLIETTVAAVAIPVTLKTRLGWDRACLNASQLARQAEQAGVQMITIHGRTRCDFYKGRADWNAIRAIKEAVSIPVVANGDCMNAADARAMLEASGADAVMVGRAAVGRPWLVGSIARDLAGEKAIVLKSAERRDMALEHYDALLTQFGPVAGTRHARKHLAGYLAHGAPEAPETDRLKLLTSEDPRLVSRLLSSLLQDAPALAA